jgi:hypothetical protein
MVHLYKHVTSAKYIDCVEKIRLFALRFHFRIQKLRFDAGSIENSKLFDEYLVKHGIEPCPASVEHKNQNPVERYVRTIKDTVSAMMFNQKVITPQLGRMALTMAVSL